jgi:CubicO group peptidase (beta-lactamase class C family)
MKEFPKRLPSGNQTRKIEITIRQLLTLTSGLDTGQNGRPPAYSEAINFSAKYDAGKTFEYGPVPFQVFGEILRRKLA